MNKYEIERTNGTWQLPTFMGMVRHHKHSSFNLYFISDLHCGAVDCNYALLKNCVDMIAKDKKALVIVGGDTIEAIPNGYYINAEGQHCSLDEQISKTSLYLEPIRDKIVVMFKGNHNTKSRGESIDSDFMIAQMLQVPYKTVPTMIQIHTPSGTVKAAGGHGNSTTKNNDLELESVRKIYPGACMYFLGHTHVLYCKQSGALQYTPNGEEVWDPVWYLRTGNFLNYSDYARYAMYAPQRSGFIKMEIKGGKVIDGHTITDDFFKKEKRNGNKGKRRERSSTGKPRKATSSDKEKDPVRVVGFGRRVSE